MPHYSYLAVELKCPSCSSQVADRLWFQWGYSPGRAPLDEQIYHVGDTIRWKSCKDGSTPSWVYFSERGGANLGDPTVHNVIVKDWAQFFLRELCPVCQHKMGGGAMRIVDNRVSHAWICSPGELDENVDIFIIENNGSLTPKPEWNDHSMSIIEEC